MREQQEASLVTQEKLVQTKNERVPKIADVTMRPVMTNRKTQGVLEAHANGLRFRSNRAENLDVMYKNIKVGRIARCKSALHPLNSDDLKVRYISGL
jgi:nucleosome binding factor SPN SPT16 subunit